MVNGFFSEKKYQEQWFLKSMLTIVLSQISILLIIFFVGPSKDIPIIDSVSEYLMKGSLFLSSLSIASNLMSTYFFDKREDNKDLVFEINKVGLIFLILIILSSGISYAVLPEVIDWYFMIVQIVIYIALIYWIFKINHIVHNKESYSKEIDKKGKETMEASKEVTEHNGISF